MAFALKETARRSLHDNQQLRGLGVVGLAERAGPLCAAPRKH